MNLPIAMNKIPIFYIDRLINFIQILRFPKYLFTIFCGYPNSIPETLEIYLINIFLCQNAIYILLSG